MNLIEKYGDVNTLTDGSVFIEQTDPDTFEFCQIQPFVPPYSEWTMWFVTEGAFSLSDFKTQDLDCVRDFMGFSKGDLLTSLDIAYGIIEYYGNHYGETSQYYPEETRELKRLIKLWENKVTKSDKHVAKLLRQRTQ